MHILVTNDDGISAPGLQVAIKLATKIGSKISVIAPSTEKSGVSHAITYNTAMSFHHLESGHFSLDGNPADCVLVAKELLGEKPDLVISGVNRGHNLGPDLIYSGTVGAAIEATAQGIPAISISQKYGYSSTLKSNLFEASEHFAALAVQPILDLFMKDWPKGKFVNINFPPCSKDQVRGIRTCQAEEITRSNMIAIPDEAPNGRKIFWIGHPGPLTAFESGTDVDCLAQNYITISICHINLNDEYMTAKISALNTEF